MISAVGNTDFAHSSCTVFHVTLDPLLTGNEPAALGAF